MLHRPPLARFGWLALAAVQFALPGAAAWADARLDAAGARAAAHFESHTSDSCARVHPPDCALCQFLTAPLTCARPARPAFSGTRYQVSAIAAPEVVRHLRARPHPHPRAPPVRC